MRFAGHCTCVCALDAVRNIQGASRWAAKAHSQEWLCHVPSTSCWAKIFGVPLGLAWRKFRSSRPSGTQYLRMCVVNAVGNIQGASRWAAKAHSQEWLCHVPSTSCWAKVFGVPLGLAWGKFRLSRTPGLSTCVCALWRQWGTFKGLPPGRKNAQPGMAVPRTQHFMLG